MEKRRKANKNMIFTIVIYVSCFLLSLSFLDAQNSDQVINKILSWQKRSAPADTTEYIDIPQEGLPIVQDTIVHFFLVTRGLHVSVAGDFNGWDPARTPMINIPHTPWWTCTQIFQRNARLEYKYVIDDSLWILDRFNPFVAPGGFGDNSEIRMPGYVPPYEIVTIDSIPHGTLSDTTFQSLSMGNSRSVRIYLPPGYPHSSKAYSVILVHDGLEYISLGRMDTILDRLIGQRSIPPVIAVFVPPVDRTSEYIEQKEAFSDFIINELMPWADRRFSTNRNPEGRLVMGSSAGGNIALWLAVNHPEHFGKAAVFSGYIDDTVCSLFRSKERITLSIYLNSGTYEWLEPVRNSLQAFLPILTEKGVYFVFEEYPEGHNYSFWRAHIDDALLFLLHDQCNTMRFQ